MRIAAASLLLLLVVGKSTPASTQAVDRIELRKSGESSLDIEVNQQGDGRYRLSEPIPEGTTGTFRLTAEQFAVLAQRLTPYRRHAVPMDDQTTRAMINQVCPAGTPYITDTGAIWVHWVGAGTDDHYLADLGCDHERNAERNADLRDIIRSLPVPSYP